MSGLLNFFKGHPSVSLLPREAIAKGFSNVLLEADYSDYETDPLNQHPLTYGTDPGNYDVRKTISEWNNRYFGEGKSKAENINLTGGASYGIANILTSATDPKSVTQRCFIVSPTYFLINSVFIDAGFEDRLSAIKETPGAEYDVDIDHFEQQLKIYSEGLEPSEGKEINVIEDPTRQSRKLYRFVMYLVPTYSNPGGITYSLKTRLKLIELARKYDVLLISDDVYELLNYKQGTRPVDRLNYLDEATLPAYKTYGNTISNASFSKIISPGIRVGWQETPTPKLVKQLASTGANTSGGTPSQLTTLVVQDLIKTGALDELLETLVSTYSSRVSTVLTSIKRYLPPSTKVFGGDGGYFMWVTIPGDIDHRVVVSELKDKHNVVLAPGDSFEVQGDIQGWGKHSVRISISYLTEEQLEEGIKRWGNVLQSFYPESFF